MKTFRHVIAVLAAAWMQVACGHGGTPAPAQTAVVAPQRDIAQANAARPANNDRHDLSEDERAGGHTLARHVGRTDAQLRERLRAEPDISAASTYTDRDAAEHTVALALGKQRARVDQWSHRSGSRPNLTLNYRGPEDEPIGRSLARNSRTVVPCYDAIVVLRWQGDGFYVLTTYPEARR